MIRRFVQQFPLTLVPATLYLALMMLVPLLLLFSFGFLEIQRGVPTGQITFSAYREILTDPFYWFVFLRTFLIASTVTGLCLLLGYPIAYLYSLASKRWKMVLLLCILAPLITSALVRTFGWIVILGNDGAVNNLLLQLGLLNEPIQFLYSLNGVLVGMTQILLPFMIVPLISALDSIPRALEEAAENLGATRWTTFWSITVPQSIPGIAAGVSLVFVLAYSEFTVSILMGGGTFAVVSVEIFQTMTTLLDWGRGAAVSSVLLVTSGLFITFFNWMIRIKTPWLRN